MYLHGEPRVVWEEDEVTQMIANEQLKFAIVGKFSYGWPESIEEINTTTIWIEGRSKYRAIEQQIYTNQSL